MEVLLSTTYFGPVQWYQKLHRAEHVLIEQWESFQKQTYRNRCLIATSNGIQALSVPVERNSQFIKDLRISDHGNWRHLHWNALMSAYGESPFFEYYQDDIRPFFEQRWTYLFDFNEAICTKMCELLDFQPNVDFTDEFVLATVRTQELKPSIVDKIKDFRETIRPKHPQCDPDFTPRPYYQVWQQRLGFLPNLSILDLLFNMGPESIFYL